MKKQSSYLKIQKAKDTGITLIALVVTIIVLLILAGVTIGMATSNDGIIKRASNAADTYQLAKEKEDEAMDSWAKEMDKVSSGIGSEFDETQKLNKPILKTGMTPVTYDESSKSFIETTSDNKDKAWYDYANKKWANAKTKDGSLWVWIPRYAYRINSSAHTTTIQFLAGKTDKYIDGNGNVAGDVKRCSSKDDTIDTTTGLTVEPAFTNESGIEYRNGGWDDELYGIWVAKFEAAYQYGTEAESVNKSKAIPSTVKYTQNYGWLRAGTDGKSTNDDYSGTARDYINGTYGSNTTLPNISYPTFQGSHYSMCYINHNDSFNLARSLTSSGNIYGFSSDSDSHLMKNSEWGAVAYLSQSQYGLNGTDIAINSVNLNDTTNNVFAVTGCAGGSTANNWTTTEGQKASTTGNVYGIYDMSGGTWERSAAYVNNGNGNLKAYGNSVLGDDVSKSTKYKTVYDANDTGITDYDKASTANYNYGVNAKIYGDAVRETSTAGVGSTSWYGDYSYFPGYNGPFFERGGYFWNGSGAGLFYFIRSRGNSYYCGGFRAVVV